MQKIILFIEPSDREYETPVKIGNLFMNRFAIDEDASTEILKIFEFGKTPYSFTLPSDLKAEDFVTKENYKGTDNFNMTRNLTSRRL